MVAAAVVAAGALAAGATAYAGSEAASATENSTNASINAQETAQQKQQALNAPYAAIGTGGAISQYKALLGLGPGGSAGELSALQNTPGYKFTQQQGTQNTVNQASAMGLGLSGNTLEALSQFNSGLADSTYQNAVGNAQNAVTIGQNAAAGSGAGILQTGAGVAGALSNQGNTLAGINVNEAAGITKALSGGANNLVTLNTLNNLSPTVATGSTAGLGYDYGSATGLAPATG